MVLIVDYVEQLQSKKEAPVSTDRQCNCIDCMITEAFEKELSKSEEPLKGSKQDVLDAINERLEEIKNEFTGYMYKNECIPDALNVEYNTLVENGRQLIDELNKEAAALKAKQESATWMKPTPSFKQQVLDAITLRISINQKRKDLTSISVYNELADLYNDIIRWQE